ncbi:MAG: bifunctional phosphoribosyl-AMP cyclohydrolase/phosphoribosyl-ATP pyrophosphatase, partial [Chloroflexi bacterium]|nr:bifunctional phosphoribosyl-AMP cyclohydrolase/phosphoribosyl-ATP pyrophosphatase [Chloroflexota bacterium]
MEENDGDLPLEALRWDEHGLIPVVVQDIHTGTVLMVAYMNREALRLSLEQG